jgi:hypothetical protein
MAPLGGADDQARRWPTSLTGRTWGCATSHAFREVGTIAAMAETSRSFPIHCISLPLEVKSLTLGVGCPAAYVSKGARPFDKLRAGCGASPFSSLPTVHNQGYFYTPNRSGPAPLLRKLSRLISQPSFPRHGLGHLSPGMTRLV